MATQPKIVVVGSFNFDLVVRAPRRPQKGETVVGSDFGMFPGGKGFNQALAARRLGAQVEMVGRVGADLFGERFLAMLREEGIGAQYVGRDPQVATGVGMPVIDADGDNSIIVALGANMRLTEDDVDGAASAIAGADVLLLQLEVPVEASRRAATIARQAGVEVILNPAPAPAQPLPADFLRCVDIIAPNETEAKALTGLPVTDQAAAERAARVLFEQGVPVVILTLGERGALLATSPETRLVPAYRVKAVDTTAAGDAFCGALAVALAEDRSLDDAVAYANAAGAWAVTIMGAAPSMPRRDELNQFITRMTW